MKERNHWSLRRFSTSRFMRGMTLGRSNSSALSVARASPIIHQMILMGKWQTPFKYTKCTPESVNVNIIILGAALSRNDVTFPGERVVSKNLGKVIRWGWGLIVDPKWHHFWTAPYCVHVRRTGYFSLCINKICEMWISLCKESRMSGLQHC